MKIRVPQLFREALRFLRAKRLLPTTLSSAELALIDGETKRGALFSARTSQVNVLGTLQGVLDGMLQGVMDLATAKLHLLQTYADLGYTSEGGFPQDAPGAVPPARRGSLRDLASKKRMEFTINTNYRMAANHAYMVAGQSKVRMFQFPAMEMVRIAPRRVPRGYVERGGNLVPKPGDDWFARWQAAGGDLFDGGTRMIALKTSPVWAALGNGAGGYTDVLNNPFPPFAFGSGYGVREISRNEALMLGVIDEATAPPADLPAPLLARAAAIAKDMDPAVLDKFRNDLKVRIAEGEVALSDRLNAEAQAAREAYLARQGGAS